MVMLEKRVDLQLGLHLPLRISQYNSVYLDVLIALPHPSVVWNSLILLATAFRPYQFAQNLSLAHWILCDWQLLFTLLLVLHLLPLILLVSHLVFRRYISRVRTNRISMVDSLRNCFTDDRLTFLSFSFTIHYFFSLLRHFWNAFYHC